MKCLLNRWMLLLLAPLACGSVSGALFEGVNDAHYPWLYHSDHGWMYATEGSNGGAWVWDMRLGWVWTSEGVYPRVYEPLAGWVEYARGSHGPRRFLDMSTVSLLVDEAPSNQVSYFPVPTEWEVFTWFYTVNGGQPVSGTIDGVTMDLDFWEYKVTFRGTDLKRSTSLRANISGSAYLEGAWYNLGGNIYMLTDEWLLRSALGLYQEEIGMYMQMRLTLDGQGTLLTLNGSAFGFDELLMEFPWQVDLFELPIGTVFYQQIPNGTVAGTVKFEINGYPEETVTENFSAPFDPLPTLRMEIVARHDHYFLSNGHPFQRVVEVLVNQTVADPASGFPMFVETRLWLAPGIGMIRSVEQNPLLDGGIVVEYSHSSM